MHICSSSTQGILWNSEIHLEEERIEEQTKSKSENGKQKNTVSPDYPTPIVSDYPTKAAGLSDARNVVSDKGSDHSPERVFASWKFLLRTE